MIDKDLIYRKLSRLKMYLDRLAPIAEKTFNEYNMKRLTGVLCLSLLLLTSATFAADLSAEPGRSLDDVINNLQSNQSKSQDLCAETNTTITSNMVMPGQARPGLATVGLISSESNLILYETQKKEPWLGVLGDFFIPTLGHYYAGDWPRGLIFPGQMLGTVLTALAFGSLLDANSSHLALSFGLSYYGTALISIPVRDILQLADSYAAVEDHNRMLQADLGISKEKPGIYRSYYQEVRNPNFAVGYAFMFPSLGHYYAGDWGRGLDYLWKEFAVLSIPAVYSTGVAPLVVGFGFAFLKISEVADAATTAEDFNAKLRSKYGLQ